MKNVAYKNHDAEINELINLLVENKTQVILYNSHEGYGNTAFIQRIMYLLHVTDKYKLLYAELSPSAQNPLHEATKNIICKKMTYISVCNSFPMNRMVVWKSPLYWNLLLKI